VGKNCTGVSGSRKGEGVVWLRTGSIVSKYGKLKEQKVDTILPHYSISSKLKINLLNYKPIKRENFP
jgi:hypothetical protein